MRPGRLAPVVLLLVLPACDLLSDPSLPAAVERRGPRAVLAGGVDGGRAWDYVIQRTEDGYCEAIRVEGDGADASTCSTRDELAPSAIDARVAGRSGQPTFVSGQVGRDIARVVIETRFDGTFEAKIVEAAAALDLPVRFMIVPLPEGSTVVSTKGFDAAGALIQELDSGLSP